MVRFTQSGNADGIQLPPMLLLPLIENAFKHGDLSEGTIDIELSIAADRLSFTCQNDIAPAAIEGEKGIGLDNIERRLELIKPGSFELATRRHQHKFLVSLTINNL